MQPGRKSASSNVLSLAANNPRTVLTPIGSPPLNKDERAIFNHVAKANSHLKPLDVPVLMLYAAAVHRAMKGRNHPKSTFDKDARAALALGRSLRLTPQSTTQPMTAARRREAASRSYYQKSEEQDDE